MRIQPIVTKDIIFRYRKMDTSKVLDAFTNTIIKTSNADSLIKKLNKVGLINARILDNNATRPFKMQKHLLDVVV